MQRSGIGLQWLKTAEVLLYAAANVIKQINIDNVLCALKDGSYNILEMLFK